ncbi:alpha/beta hydrolase [[Actinomadura] parvosata subsp. kistnae]|uniref:Alpha/beta hydrolase n=1 Tax=[Actinomadura] parvosata subsp. kistnae TaxID=1909395 RepID=A0A1U9ZQS2_9ACTN|nr:alpha/beta hydrolase [Nonomuraea sp. ATCC 55076]AQZ60292.1 alpha/beta hydrolase [Nonomuraea sp. ATCC 55076]
MMTETTRAVPVAGGSLDVRTGGHDGPALVFVHYWGGSAGTWSEVIRRLPAGQATVRFDQRGWGSSRALPGPYDLDRLADDLLQVVATAVRGPYVLVGHSMGGKVSQLAAARRPAGLAGLVLVAPAPPRPPASVTKEYRQGLSHAYDSPETVRHALDHVLTAGSLPEAVREAAVRDSLAADAQARHEWPLRGIARDISPAVRDVEVPVLVLAGEKDVVEPPQVLRDHLLPYLPQAAMTVVPGAGHLLPLEAPGAVATALAGFLATAPLPDPRSAGDAVTR